MGDGCCECRWGDKVERPRGGHFDGRHHQSTTKSARRERCRRQESCAPKGRKEKRQEKEPIQVLVLFERASLSEGAVVSTWATTHLQSQIYKNILSSSATTSQSVC